jgi:hypothetical protein
MVIMQHHAPLRARQALEALAYRTVRIDVALLTRFPVDIGASIDRIGQHLMGCRVSGRDPSQCALGGLRRERQGLAAEPQPHAPCGTHLGKALEHGADGVGDRRIGVQAHLAVGLAPDQPNGQSSAQLPACGLVADAAVEPCAQHVQFRFGHGALEAEHEPIVEQARVIEPVGIADQRIGGAAQIQQSIPIGIITRQARHLQSKHDADLAECHRGGELRKARARAQTCARDAQVLVDDLDLRRRPAELCGEGLQMILPLGRLAAVRDLGIGGLANINHRQPRPMGWRDPVRFSRPLAPASVAHVAPGPSGASGAPAARERSAAARCRGSPMPAPRRRAVAAPETSIARASVGSFAEVGAAASAACARRRSALTTVRARRNCPSVARTMGPGAGGPHKSVQAAATQRAIRDGACLTSHARAKASTSEEPDAGKPHVRVCGGGPR